jgi:RNAse (barnase) inhibitor barstar
MNTFSCTIDLSACSSKDELLQHIYAALQFPDDWGKNWDALADGLCDLSWLDADEYHLSFNGIDTFRAQHPTLFEILGEIADGANLFWKTRLKITMK